MRKNSHALETVFLQHLRERAPFFTAQSPCLIGVSGGVDSMVLLHLCIHAVRAQVWVAHCNFGLRGLDSDADEKLVHDYCAAHKLPFSRQSFNVADLQKTQGGAMEEVARRARYAWWHELMDTHKIKCLLTAHHADDNIETSFMHFCRGTGLLGLAAMPYVHKNHLRPLLFFQKHELYDFARAENIPFREDASNALSDYTRNFFRLQIIPTINARIPSFKENVLASITRYQETYALYEQYTAQIKNKLWTREGSDMRIFVRAVLALKPLSTWVYLLFKDKGVRSVQVPEIIKLLHAPSGKFIETDTHILFRHRSQLIARERIFTIHQETPPIVWIHQIPARVALDDTRILRFRAHKKTAFFDIPKDKNYAFVDARALHFPCIIRPCRAGDYFYPLGLNKKKKIARYLIDEGVPQYDRAKVWVVESAQKIIWVIGMRMDHRARVQETTTEMVKISVHPLK